MKKVLAIGVSLGLLCVLGANTAEISKKKLRVFVLSGQSNMVGHSRTRLLANLLVSPRAEDAELAKLLIVNHDEVVRSVKPKMEAIQKKIDALADPVAKARKELNEVAGAETKAYKESHKNDVAVKKEEQAKGGKKKKGEPDIPKSDRWLAKQKEVDDVSQQVEALCKEKGALMDSIQYKTGSKVHIAAFGEIDKKKSATGITGPIATGCGADLSQIGPEYGFGMALEKLLDAPVLLIKVSWGGIDLDGGFRPPSSKQVGNETAPGIAPGPKYEALVKQVRDVLSELPKYYPGYDSAAGYEMAGFLWFQGFNDQFGDKPTRYKEHMVNFIRDIRAEFKTPKMPFVIGVIGTSSTDKNIDYGTISHAEAVAHGKKQTAEHAVAVAQREAAALPEFAGNVSAVESYPYYDYAIVPIYSAWQQRFPEWNNAGSDRAYHYLGSARFFARFGNACAETMATLMNNQK